MPSYAQVAEAVTALCPDLADRPVRLAGRGECNEAWWVGGEHIFRFAMNEEAGQALELEAEVLPELARSLDARIPIPELIGADPATGLLVLGSRAVKGEPLTRQRFEGLPSAKKARLAEELGQFVAQMQRFQWRELDVAFPETRFHSNHREAKIERLVLPRLDPRRVQACLVMRDEFLIAPNASWKLLHADLYEEHILLDPTDDGLAGIIDFGDICVGDPACELAPLIDDLGIELTRQAIATVAADRSAETLVQRGLFYCVWDALVWAADQLELGNRTVVEAQQPSLERLIDAAR